MTWCNCYPVLGVRPSVLVYCRWNFDTCIMTLYLVRVSVSGFCPSGMVTVTFAYLCTGAIWVFEFGPKNNTDINDRVLFRMSMIERCSECFGPSYVPKAYCGALFRIPMTERYTTESGSNDVPKSAFTSAHDRAPSWMSLTERFLECLWPSATLTL